MSSYAYTYGIVIPAYREAELIESTLERLAAYLQENDMHASTEVIVVAADGGDQTAALARAKAGLFTALQVIEPGTRVGKGRDTRAGILSSRAQYVAYMDADLATPLSYTKQLFASLESGADIVIGTRTLRHIHTGLRMVGSVVANIIIQALAVPGIRDTQCGFKGFRADVAQRLFSRMTILGWGFDIELLVMARLSRMKIAQIKIPDWKDPKAADVGLSGDSPVRALIATFRELLIIKRNRYQGKYKGV